MLIRRHSSALLLGICLLAASATSQAAPPPDQAALVVVTPADAGHVIEIKRELEALGASLPHRFTSGLLVGAVPPAAEARFEAPGGVTVRILREGRDLRPGARDSALPAEMRAARRFLQGPTRTPRSHPLEEMGGDLAEPLPLDRVVQSLGKALPSRECDRPGATSAFLAGSVAIGILLPESTGTEDTENWATEDPALPGQDRQDLVVAEIMEGCDFLAAQLPQAGLSFVYDVHRSVGIPHEPALHDVGSRGLWIQDIMDQLAFGGYSETASVGSYLNDLRDRQDTDWAIAAFVADNLNHDAAGWDGWGNSNFPFAYALLGGPYLVMNYYNDGFGIANMDAVMKHEMAHTFGALDEYASAGNSCTNTSGYLTVPNQNNASVPACLDNESCIMRGGTPIPVCPWTLGQLGIRDTDGDGILDVRDAPPDSRFNESSPLLSGSADVTLTGLVTALSRDDESPNSPAYFTINRVSSAEWSIDGGAWTALAADDGAYGGRCETFTLALTGLAEGWHDLEVRGTNDVGLIEPSPAKVRVYVNTDCVDDASEPDDGMAAARPRPARSYAGLHHCAYDQDWSRFHLSSGASIDITLRFPSLPANLAMDLLDAAGNVVVAGAVVTPGELHLTHVAGWDGTYYLRVDGPGEDETDYSLDVVADCIDDVFEPNATPAVAPLVATLTYPDLALCAGDLDHYAISVQAGESLNASLAFDGALGDLDLEVLDPVGASAGVSNGTGDTESVAVTPTLQGVYVVKVYGKMPTDTNVYSMDVAATGCLDDERENDDTSAAAKPLPAGADVRARLCGADVDWYSFTVSDVQLVRVQAVFDATAANLDLELYDATGTRLVGRSTSRTGFEDITSERLQPGTYLLRVFAADAGSTSYTLSLQVTDPILLKVHKDATDAILTWSAAQQECYLYRRSEIPSDFTAAVTAIVQDGSESVADREYRDRNVILDGHRLYCYLVSPADCGSALTGSTKTVSPYPVLTQGIGTITQLEYTITLANNGTMDAFGARVVDDLPTATQSYAVLQIPPGSVDNSQPAPAGAFMRGQIRVDGINVPRGGTAVVRFSIQPSRSAFEFPAIDNQATVLTGDGPTTAGNPSPTDDPATYAVEDDTRVMVAFTDQRAHVHAMWHQYVDLDLRVIDPCGNVVSPQDLATATCGSTTDTIRRDSTCAVQGNPTRFATVEWANFGQPSSGTYHVEVAYVSSTADDPACRGRGPEDVTVAYVPPFGAPQWITTTVEPGAGFVPVMEFTVP